VKKLLIGFALMFLSAQAFSACPTVLPDDTLCLSWIAPVENVDGSDLLDLEGFEVFWGFFSGDYNDTRKLDIPDETQTQLTTPTTSISIPNPGPGGGDVNVFFVMTAYDEGVERGPTVNCTDTKNDDANDPGNEVKCRNISAFSNEVVKVIIFPDSQTPGAPRELNVIINVDTT